MARAKVQAGGVLRTSLDNSWQTPERELEAVRAYFGGPIPFDPATCPENPTKATTFCAGPPGTMFAGSLGDNGLEVEWTGRGGVFVNPPYGRELRDWLRKMTAEATKGCAIIALLPASRWEMDYMHAALRVARFVCLRRGRIAFISSADGKPVKGNPGPSMFLGFNVDGHRFLDAFRDLGLCLLLEAAP